MFVSAVRLSKYQQHGAKAQLHYCQSFDCRTRAQTNSVRRRIIIRVSAYVKVVWPKASINEPTQVPGQELKTPERVIRQSSDMVLGTDGVCSSIVGKASSATFLGMGHPVHVDGRPRQCQPCIDVGYTHSVEPWSWVEAVPTASIVIEAYAVLGSRRERSSWAGRQMAKKLAIW